MLQHIEQCMGSRAVQQDRRCLSLRLHGSQAQPHRSLPARRAVVCNVSWQDFVGRQQYNDDGRPSGGKQDVPPSATAAGSYLPKQQQQQQLVPPGLEPPSQEWRVRAGIISPRNPWYRAWRGLLTAAAGLTGLLVPWELGFVPPGELYDGHHAIALLDGALVALFMADIGVSHLVAYEQDELLVDSPALIATNYRRQRLALDLLSGAPWDAAVLAGALLLGHQDWGAATSYAAWFKALHLLRLYRVRGFFTYLEYDLSLSLLTVTLARNLVIVAYLTHWVACGFEGLARGAGYDPDYLVGMNPALFRGAGPGEQYLYSLYWSVTTLAGNEWSGMDAVSDMRQVAATTGRAGVFLLFNIALGAYILGTITLLVVKNDERTGRYRDLSSNLRQYSTTHQLPPELKQEMQEHLRLNFNHQDASDEQVLSIYPATIRRRILRHLYSRHLRASYLFKGTPRKFLDAVLAGCRLELFKGGVDILGAGDAVNELFLVVAGRVELRSPLDVTASSYDPQYDWGGESDGLDDPYTTSVTSTSLLPTNSSSSSSMSPGTSTGFNPLTSVLGTIDQDAVWPGGGGVGVQMPHVGPRRVRGPGQTFGAISFFTEIPQMDTVRSLTTVRVMVLSRAAWESLERHFPLASRLVLENLKRRAERAVADEFPGVCPNTPAFQQLLSSCPGTMMYSWASPELVELLGAAGSQPKDRDTTIAPVRDPSSSSSSSSGSSGSLSGSSSSVDQWQDPSAITVDDPDYSIGNPVTSSLAVRAAQSSRRMQELVLRSRAAKGSDGGVTASGDTLGVGSLGDEGGGGKEFTMNFTPGQELVLSNLVRVLNVISTHVAKQDEDRTNEFLYAATRGDSPKLRAMLQQGFNPDMPDYDGRTALMLGACKGHTDVVDLLLLAGANPHARDKLGRTSLLEACYAGHEPVIGLLMAAGSRLGLHGDLKALEVASLLCSCVYLCDLPLLRRLVRAGADVNAGDYDRRTALHISAAEGNAVMVRVLVEEGGANIWVTDRWGHTPLDEARRVGARVVVDYLGALVAQREEATAWRTARKQRSTAAAAAAAAGGVDAAGGDVASSTAGVDGTAAASMSSIDAGSANNTSSSSSSVSAYSRGPTVTAQLPSGSGAAVALGAPFTRSQDNSSMTALPSAASQAAAAAAGSPGSDQAKGARAAATGSTSAVDQSSVSVDQPGGTSGNNVLPVQPPNGAVTAGSSNGTAAGTAGRKAEEWCPPSSPAAAAAAAPVAAVPPVVEVLPVQKRR